MIFSPLQGCGGVQWPVGQSVLPSGKSFGGCSFQRHLGPWAVTQKTAIPLRGGQVLSCCASWLHLVSPHPSVLPIRAGPRLRASPGFQQAAFEGVGGLEGALFTGGSPPETPREGLSSFPSTPSSWHPALASHSLLSPVSPVLLPDLSHSCSEHSRSLCPTSARLVPNCAFSAVSTHSPCACLGQSRVPKAHISCLFMPMAAMPTPPTMCPLSCAVPDADTDMLSPRHPALRGRPPGQARAGCRPPLALPHAQGWSAFRTHSIYSP